MADVKKSFSELLSEAPLAAQEDTVSLVGALGRSSQSGKFVLTMGSGNRLTLDISAVKGYQVLGGGVGQLLVQLDIDRERVPSEAAVPFAMATPHQAPQNALAAMQGIGAVPSIQTLPTYDTFPIYDTGILRDKHPWSDATGVLPWLD